MFKAILRLTICSIFISGCASTKDFVARVTRPTPPKQEVATLKNEDRFKEYIEDTEVDAVVSYTRAQAWAASAYKNGSQSAIQYEDQATYKFIARGFLSDCQGLGNWRHYEVSFLLDFQAKNKRVRILFDKILMTNIGQQHGSGGNPVAALMSSNLPTTKDELDKIAANCLEPIKATLMKEIQTDKGTKNW